MSSRYARKSKWVSGCVDMLGCVRLFAIPWTVAPLSMGFSRQKYWRGLPFYPPGDLPDRGIEPVSLASPALAGRFFTTEPLGSLGLGILIQYDFDSFAQNCTFFLEPQFDLGNVTCHHLLPWHGLFRMCENPFRPRVPGMTGPAAR